MHRKILQKGSEAMTAEQVGRALGKTAETVKQLMDAEPTVAGLMNLWKILTPKYHKEISRNLSFSKKEMRFFKLFLGRVSHPMLVIVCIIKNWSEYVDHCKTYSGAFRAPLSPKIEFLVGYVNEAWYIFECHKNGRAADVKVTADLVTLTEVDETRDIATKEDIQRILSEIEDEPGDSN